MSVHKDDNTDHGSHQKFEDHEYVLLELKKAQEAEVGPRDAAREAHYFIDKRDGQWESSVSTTVTDIDKPKYTFDLTTNVITQIAGKIKQADFAGEIKPIGGEATKELAATYDGMVRNIQSISQAVKTYNSSGKNMVTAGIDGWEILQEFIDDDSFDQDIIIENVENFVDRVWWNESAEKQDRSDAIMGWKFTGFSKDEYKKKWPKGNAIGLKSNKIFNAYFNKPDLIMVGTFYYIKETKRELVLMSNGATYEDDKKFKKVKKELAALGIEEMRRRKRTKKTVWSRKMDQGGFLTKPEKTVFDFIPLVPVFANYKISDGKTIYYGAVEKRLDPQRVFNYAMSRQIEEGALAPRAKYWVTSKQAEGHSATLATLNTNSDPVQEYEPDPMVAVNPPQQQGGAVVNEGLAVITQTVGALIPQSAGLFAANLGDNPNAQSGVAIEKLQDKGDVGTIDYIESMEIAICHTMRIIIKAIPKVYVGQRQFRILKEDSSFEMVMLNELTFDEETQKDVVLNNLSVGNYDVTCSAGPSFQNRQQETVSAMVEIGQVDPSIIGIGSDILLNNVTAPGMSLIADRKRQQLFEAGIIPLDQMTDEEKELIEQAQQQAAANPPPPDPAVMIGQAELISARNEEARTQVDIQEKGAKIQLAARKEDREDAKLQGSMRNNMFGLMLQQQKQQQETQAAIVQALNTQADTLNKIREAMGLETIVGPGNTEAYIKQARIVQDSQTEQ